LIRVNKAVRGRHSFDLHQRYGINSPDTASGSSAESAQRDGELRSAILYMFDPK